METLTFLFTDLTESTALYERIGQARAFSLVQEHFRILDTAVVDHNGTVVKTIGDAVMAVFPTPGDGVAAAFAMQERIAKLDTLGSADPRRLLKVGVHSGAALAVTQNERLDYFGTAVNVASRIEHRAGGGQIAISQATLADPVVQAQLLALRVPLTEASADLRGIDEPIKVGLVDAPGRG